MLALRHPQHAQHEDLLLRLLCRQLLVHMQGHISQGLSWLQLKVLEGKTLKVGFAADTLASD